MSNGLPPRPGTADHRAPAQGGHPRSGLRGPAGGHAIGRGGLRRRRLRSRRGQGQGPGRRRVLRDRCLLGGGAPTRWRPAATGPRATRTSSSGFDVAVIDVPTPLREGVPDLSHVEQPTRMPRTASPGRFGGDPGINDLSRDHGGAGRADPRSPVRPGGRHRLPSRLQPGADRPGERDLDLPQHAEGRLGSERGLAGRRSATSSTRSSRRRCRWPGPARPR